MDMIELVTEKPWWYLLFCLLAGVVYALVLYYKDTSIPAGQVYLKRFLATVRGVLIALLAFLLLTPLIKSFQREVEKPLVVIAQDNSESIVALRDSQQIKNEYAEKIKELAEKLQSKYEVKIIQWGDKVKETSEFSFSDKESDFSGMLDEVNVRYGFRNFGALVIASDGLYNKGSNPVYHTSQVKAPYYVVALGDTTVRKDVRIGKVNFNKVVYLGNSFPVEVSVEANQVAGSQVSLTVQKDSSVLFKRQVNISNNQFQQQVNVLLDASQKGIHHYKIKLSTLPGEVSLANNEKDIYIEVRESKEKILILAEAPHPDIAALKQAIEQSQNYEVKAATIEQFEGKVNDYNLVILHQLPSTRHNVQEILNKLVASHTSLLFVLGAESSFNTFNKSNSGLTIGNAIGKSNNAEGLFNNDFSWFTLSDETKNAIMELPPLNAPFGEYRQNAGTSSLLFQKIGSVQTRTPLLLFNEEGERRTGVLAGEGFWRWRLSDYSMHENFNATNEVIQKSVQFLSNKEQKSKFRISNKVSIPENEQVIFDAEVYNDNYELINQPDVSMVITNKERKSFSYSFSKTDKAYTLNAGYFQPGEYSYKASVKVGEKQMIKEGIFSVNALQLELSDLTANHAMLQALSHKHGGTVFYPTQLDQLADSLLSRDDIKAVSYSNYKLQDLINLKWVFFLLLALLSIEWFVRKRSGAY